MFQYASGLGIAKKLNMKFAIDIEGKHSDTHFKVEQLQQTFEITHLENITKFDKDNNWKRYHDGKCSTFNDGWKNLPKGHNLQIWGFFQSYKYFQGIEQEIRK